MTIVGFWSDYGWPILCVAGGTIVALCVGFVYGFRAGERRAVDDLMPYIDRLAGTADRPDARGRIDP